MSDILVGGLDALEQVILLERLLDHVEGARLHGLNRHGHIGMAGKEDNGDGQAALAQGLLQFQAAHAGHAQVEQDAGDVVRVKIGEEILAVGEADERDIGFLHHQPDGIAHTGVVVHKANGRFLHFGSHGFRGRAKRNVAPRGVLLRTQRRP